MRQVVGRSFFSRNATQLYIGTFLEVYLTSHLRDLMASENHTEGLSFHVFLKDDREAVKCLEVQFSIKYLFAVPRKVLYWDLMHTLFRVTRYRLQNLNLPDHDILTCVPPAKSFLFILLSSILPVKLWRKECGVFVSWSVNCCLCNTHHPIEHWFIFARNLPTLGLPEAYTEEAYLLDFSHNSVPPGSTWYCCSIWSFPSPRSLQLTALPYD